jgi:8-oxo-dGTP pyrophosphatase MutT (NUDIX family)
VSSDFEPLLDSLKSTDVNDDFGIYTIRQTVTALTEQANLDMPAERRISLSTALTVADRSLVASASRDNETRRLLAVRDVARFLSVAAEGDVYGNTTEFSDLLPTAHPHSTATHELSIEELRQARASWIAADPRIDDSMRSVVASAYAAEPLSAESTYFFTRLSVANPSLVPYDIATPLVAALGMGTGANKGYWEVQLRNPNNGQWIEMGGGVVGYVLDADGNLHAVVGVAVGISKDGSTVDVAVTGHPVLGSGIFPFKLGGLENVEAILPEKAVRHLRHKDVTVSSEKLAMAMNAVELMKQRKDIPTGWEVIDAPKTEGGPDVAYRLTDSGYIVEVYNGLNAGNTDNALNSGTEVPGGAKDMGAGAGGKFDSKKPVLVLKRDASPYKGEGETEVVARAQSWGGIFKAAKEDKNDFQKAVDTGKESPAAAESTTVADIAKAAKVDTKALDAFLSDFIAKYPEQKFAKNFEGDPEHATEELIGRLDKPGNSKDSIAAELSDIAFNLPDNNKFDAAKKSIMSLVDSVLEHKPGTKKPSKKKIAEIPAPEAEAPAVETPELDKFDEPKLYEKISKGQLENLKPGEQVMVLPKVAAPSPYDKWNPGHHKHSVFTKNEDGTFSDHWGKSYTIDQLWKTKTSVLDKNKEFDLYDFMYVGNLESGLEPYLNPDYKGPKGFHDKYKPTIDDYEALKKLHDEAVAAKRAKYEEIKASSDGKPVDQHPDYDIYKALEKREQALYTSYNAAAKLVSAKKHAEWFEANEAQPWTNFREGDESPNLSFIENAPVGTVVSFNTNVYHENGDIQFEGLHVVATKTGPNQWKMEDDEGHYDYDKYSNKDVWDEADTIDYIPPYLEPEQEPFAIVNLDDLKQVSGAKGSNDGGIFEDADGNQYYVKFPKSELHAQNEVLASRLYKALGIEATDMQLGEYKGKPAVFSPMIPDSKADLVKKLGDEEYMKQIQDGFAVDAWLANWDVAGLVFDNIVTNGDGKPVRVDPGGSLLFRAQGSPKGQAFGDDAKEIETLADGSNDQAYELFGKMSEDDKKKSAEKLLTLSDADIDGIVDMTITDPAQAEFLKETLKRRRKSILDKFNIEDTSKAPELSSEEPAEDTTDIVEAPATPETPALEGYTLKQNANGVWYPEEKLSPEDYYALRNGEKVPPQFPFLPKNTLSGDTLYFDKDGVKRWGQYGAAGTLIRRKKDDGSYEYLVVKRNAKASTDGGVWSIPGGAHDNQEDAANPASTAKRELKEELGWKLPEDAAPAAEFKNQLSDDWAYDYEVFDVSNDLDPKMGGELTEAKWVSADELKQMQTDGELHKSMDAQALDSVLSEADKADFSPAEMSDGKWWSKNDSASFRKGKSSEIVKGDIVTVKGSTGERDVVVTSDPVTEDNKVTFDFVNPENSKTGTYTWEADSNASIMSGHIDALKYTTKSEQAPEPEQAPEAPSAPEAQAPEVPVEEASKADEVVSKDEYDLAGVPITVWNMKDDSVIANFGLNQGVIEPDVNGTYSAVIKYGVTGDKIGASFFESKEDALNWIGDQVAAGLGEDLNPISGKGVGEASKGVSVHKKHNFNLATEKQVDYVKSLIESAEISDEEKQNFTNMVNKDGLISGEAGVLIGKLKAMPHNKEGKKSKEDIIDPASIETKEIQVGDKKIVEAAMDSTSGLSGHYFKDEDGNDLGSVAPSQELAGAWTTTVKSENATTKKHYSDEESAMASFGASHVESGTFSENPFGGESTSEKVASFEDAAIPETVNHDLTPVNAQDVLDANLIMDQLIGEHPDHTVLPNGDVVIETKEFTNKYGQKFRYDLVVRRTKKERFFAYVMETDLQTGERRAVKTAKEVHSYKALLNSVYKGKAIINKPSPRDWFGKNKAKTESLPPVLGEEVDVTPQLSDWLDGVGSGADIANGIADFLADLGSSNQTFAKEIIEAKLEAKGLPKEFLSDVIQIMADNKMKAAAGLPEGMFEKIEGPVAPHMSYDGVTEVKVGDTVDWTDPATGKVYRGYVVQAQYKHNSKDYKYSDQMLVILPEYNIEHGYESTRQRYRVSSNLKVVQNGDPMSEPFVPKAKEALTQEKISTGEAPEFNEPKFVAPKVSEPKAKEETPKAEAPAAPKATSIPDDIGTTKNDGAEGLPYFEIDGIQHPTYMEKDDINGAAVLGTSNPKTLEELQPGDLVNISGDWWHVLSTGTDENGDFKVAISKPTDGWPQSKVIKIDEAKKPLLNTKFASITPEKPITPTHPEKVAEADDSMPYNQGQYDLWLGITGKGEFADDKLNEMVNDINTKILLGEEISQKDMADALGQILNAPLKKNDKYEGLADWEIELLESVNNSLGTSSEGPAVKDIVDAANDALNDIKNEPKMADPAGPTYNHGFKQLSPEEVKVGGKGNNFEFLGNGTKSSEIQLGDIIRQGQNGSWGGKSYYQILAKEGRGYYMAARYTADGQFVGVQKYWPSWKPKVYRPSDKFIKKTPDYKEPTSLASVGPIDVKVVDGIKTLGSVDAVKAAGVDKKSDAGNAAFGIGDDLGDGVTPSMIGVNKIDLWKQGFNDLKVKTKNDKYVIAGGIVTDGESAGVITKTDKENGLISVTWLSGSKAGQSMDNVPANSVEDTGNWMSPQAAGDYGVSVDSAQIETGKAKIAEKVSALKAQHAKKIEQEKMQAAIEAKKKSATVKGAGASLEKPADVLPWNKSAFEGAPSLEEAVQSVQKKKGLAASFGQQVAVDSTQIEDNKVTVSAVEHKGKPVTKLNFTLTSWTADGENGIVKKIKDDPEGKVINGIKVTKLEHTEDGLMKTSGEVDSYYVGKGNGATYEKPLKDENGNIIGHIRVYRANKDLETPSFAGKSTSGSNGPLAFHNRVEVLFNDVATSQQIQKALESVGITEARPATPADTKIAMENRLIALFGDVPNGTENLTGELRQEILDEVKKTYGVSVDDIHVTNNNGVINFEIPKEIADKFAKDMNFEEHLRHGFATPSWASQDYGKYFYEELVQDAGSGGVRSAADRAMHGIYTVPGSGDQDINNTGGSYVFTGKNSTYNVGSGRSVQIYTKGGKLLSRLGLYGNSGDSWGALKGKQLTTLGQNALSEVMVKGAIPWGDVDFIKLDPGIYSKVISYFQAKGVTEINGTPLLNFFKKK